jgi:lysophospholipase L1-like esterase
MEFMMNMQSSRTSNIATGTPGRWPLTRLTLGGWVGLALLSLWPQIGQAEPVLKKGDRVVIYGDSITEQRQYSRYVQQYLYCRHPELGLKFYNAGWGGDTAPGALNRLERDVLSLNPTVVTLFFGMNDGGYKPVEESTLSRYRKGMEGLIKALQAKNIRVVVFTPGCVDPDRQPRLGQVNYNQTLEALGKVALELAEQYHCPHMDVIHPMLALQTAQKAKDAAFTMIPDSVHPAAPGHLAMASWMLQGLGAEPMPALPPADLAKATDPHWKTSVKSDEEVVLESTETVRLPFWFEAASASLMEASGFQAFASPKLTVRGLKPGYYALSVNDALVSTHSAAALADGVPLAGNGSEAGKQLHDTIARKENLYFTTWRETRLALGNAAEAQQIVQGMMAADDGYQAMIQRLSQPPGKLTVKLARASATPNLALRKRYQSSNPNAFNWGGGGLTDGSWAATDRHCFASGDSATFPKTATIDLEKAARINSVVVGVPAFGSTKTIQVALSADGKDFKEVGTHEFSLRKEDRYKFQFTPTEARYVRLTYPDHHAEEVNYSPNFSFTTECEVYGPLD